MMLTLDENDIIKHDYFGTEKVFADLSQKPGWLEGRVNLTQYRFIRDKNTDLVVGMTNI